jgi:hypothetical protein
MKPIVVKPLKKQNRILLVLIFYVILLVCSWLLPLFLNKKKKVKKLKKYQINAFSDLSEIEKSIFTDLYNSAFDIEIYHMNNTENWPDIQTLEINIISPFVRDAVWESRGHIEWRHFPAGKEKVHNALYIGKSLDHRITGSFILFLEHFHSMDGAYFYSMNRKQPFNIWYTRDKFSLPSDFSKSTLINSGWKEVIPLKRKDIRQNINSAIF